MDENKASKEKKEKESNGTHMAQSYKNHEKKKSQTVVRRHRTKIIKA